MSLVRINAVLVIAIGALSSLPVQAHPRLVGANPSPNSVVAGPKSLQLHFSERLISRFTGADILRTSGKGQAPAKLAGTKVRLEADGKTLTVVPGAPLAAGGYRLLWRAVSVDTHRVSGGYAFRVR